MTATASKELKNEKKKKKHATRFFYFSTSDHTDIVSHLYPTHWSMRLVMTLCDCFSFWFLVFDFMSVVLHACSLVAASACSSHAARRSPAVVSACLTASLYQLRTILQFDFQRSPSVYPAVDDAANLDVSPRFPRPACCWLGLLSESGDPSSRWTIDQSEVASLLTALIASAASLDAQRQHGYRISSAVPLRRTAISSCSTDRTDRVE